MWLVPAMWVGLLLLLLMPLVVTPSTLFPFVVGKALYFRLLVEILFVLWVFLAVASPRYRLHRSWIITIFALYVVINAASALVGVSFDHSFWGNYRRMGGVFDLVHWFALLLILASMVKTTDHWRWLLNVNLGISLVLALLGLAQHFGVQVFPTLFWYFESKDRLDITLGNATFVGAYMLVNALIAMAFLADAFVHQPAQGPLPKDNRRRRPVHRQGDYWTWAARSFWALVILLDFWAMTLSGTRGAIIGLGAALLFAGVQYALWGSRKRLRVKAGMATAIFLLVVVSFPLLRQTTLYDDLAKGNILLERLSTASFQSGSGEARIITSRIGLEAFASEPFLGWGPENFAFAYQRYVRASDFERPEMGDQAHNRLINELTTTGLLGFAVYLLLWIRIGWVLIRKTRSNPREDVLTVMLGAALAGYFVQNLLLFDAHATFLQAALLIGWAASSEQSTQADTEVPNRSPPAFRPTTRRGGKRHRERRTEGSSTPSQLWGLWQSQAALAYAGAVQRAAMRWMGAGLLVLLLLASLWFVIRPSYRAAQHFPKGGVGWEQLWTDARLSFETFPPLANLPRQVLFDTLVANWDAISTVGVAEIVNKVRPEELAALERDPKSPRLYLALGELYQKAAATHSEYVVRARSYVDKARILAPETNETILLLISQEILEKDYQSALDMMEEYLQGPVRFYRLGADVDKLRVEAERGLGLINK